MSLAVQQKLHNMVQFSLSLSLPADFLSAAHVCLCEITLASQLANACSLCPMISRSAVSYGS